MFRVETTKTNNSWNRLASLRGVYNVQGFFNYNNKAPSKNRAAIYGCVWRRKWNQQQTAETCGKEMAWNCVISARHVYHIVHFTHSIPTNENPLLFFWYLALLSFFCSFDRIVRSHLGIIFFYSLDVLIVWYWNVAKPLSFLKKHMICWIKHIHTDPNNVPVHHEAKNNQTALSTFYRFDCCSWLLQIKMCSSEIRKAKAAQKIIIKKKWSSKRVNNGLFGCIQGAG